MLANLSSVEIQASYILTYIFVTSASFIHSLSSFFGLSLSVRDLLFQLPVADEGNDDTD
jgi:hypothetical protein